MVVAILALVLGASGSAIAAGRLISGDKLIKKGSLSGNRLRNNSVTGKQVNASTLGKVPSAKTADLATSAVNATNAASAANAANAANAGHASNADTVGGQAPGSFEPASNWMRTGTVLMQTGTTKTLGSIGPWTFTASCSGTQAGPGTLEAKITATTTETRYDINGTTQPTTPYVLVDNSNNTGAIDNGTNTDDFEGGSGKAYQGLFDAGTDLTAGSNNQCFFSALVTPS